MSYATQAQKLRWKAWQYQRAGLERQYKDWQKNVQWQGGSYHPGIQIKYPEFAWPGKMYLGDLGYQQSLLGYQQNMWNSGVHMSKTLFGDAMDAYRWF